MQQGPTFNWYRSISNDIQQTLPSTTERMKDFDCQKADNGSIVVTVSREAIVAETAIPYTMTYTFHADGQTSLDATFNSPDQYPFPRIGLQMFLSPALENVEWYGRGPMENYPDRKDCAFVGRYQTTVTDMREHYVRSQSMGERCDTRWLQLTDDEGRGLRISVNEELRMKNEELVACEPAGNSSFFIHHSSFNFSAQHYTDRDLWQVKYGHDIDKMRRAETVLCIDAAMRGIGNGSCGPGALDEYQIKGGQTYTLHLCLSPVK